MGLTKASTTSLIDATTSASRFVFADVIDEQLDYLGRGDQMCGLVEPVLGGLGRYVIGIVLEGERQQCSQLIGRV